MSFCRYENSLSTDMCWQQSVGRCRCIPAGHLPSDLGDTTEDEEVQRDPRASSSSLTEEAQVDMRFPLAPFVFIFTDLKHLISAVDTGRHQRTDKAD